MAVDTKKLYDQRLKRYVTAMRNKKPDRIPIRPICISGVACFRSDWYLPPIYT